ncbi:hypothetical protein PUR61_30950 [Streptomyces sp. BE20]|nr:hypothetical protein [Streptomyces sp. BE20]MEE1826574.1 hypothetical protein [Streptomyces sp. BE20]
MPHQGGGRLPTGAAVTELYVHWPRIGEVENLDGYARRVYPDH